MFFLKYSCVSVYNYRLIKSSHYRRILLSRVWDLSSSFSGSPGLLEVIYNFFTLKFYYAVY